MTALISPTEMTAEIRRAHRFTSGEVARATRANPTGIVVNTSQNQLACSVQNSVYRPTPVALPPNAMAHEYRRRTMASPAQAKARPIGNQRYAMTTAVSPMGDELADKFEHGGGDEHPSDSDPTHDDAEQTTARP